MAAGQHCISESQENEEILKKNIAKNETGLFKLFQFVSFIL